MFTPRQHMLFFTVFAIILAFMLARIGGLDSGPAFLWGLLLGIALYRLQRRNILAREDLERARRAPPKPAPAPAPAPVATEPAPPPPARADKGQPARLDAPRGGKADDLKRISGIGPKLEAALNEMGYHHFDQIAAWGPKETSWMDENLPGAAGRVTRDDWVAQAKAILAEKG